MHRAVMLLPFAVALSATPHLRAQDMPESSPEALLHYAQGVDAYLKERHLEAIGHFQAAYGSDSTFHVAMFMAGLAAGNAGRAAQADSFYARVVPHRDRLSPYYQLRLDAQMAGRAGNLEGYVEANRRAAALNPGTKATYNLAQGAVQLGRAREARDALRRLDPDREPMKGWDSYYEVYTNAAHQLGDHEDELRMARHARQAFPDALSMAQLEGYALAALGRLADAERVLEEMRGMSADGALNAGQAMRNVADELAAHGNAAAARRWYERALAWFEARPAEEARTAAARNGRASMLVRLGRWSDAAPIFDELAAELPNQHQWKGWQAIVATNRGDSALAREFAHKLQSGEIRFPNPRVQHLWQGIIAAALNDRPAAMRHFQAYGVRPRWLHRDPVLLPLLGQEPRFTAYLRPTG